MTPAGAGCPPLLATVSRNGVVESAHRGQVVVCDAGGQVQGALGEPDRSVYPRSALKPLQAAAVLDLLRDAGITLDETGIAIAAASHAGSHAQQQAAVAVLAQADLDASALRCPPAFPLDLPTLLDQRVATRLAHNCSGKHAAFLLAQVASDEDPVAYLAVDSVVQTAVRERLAQAPLSPPGVDGCGAPAWRLQLRDLAAAFARLSAADGRSDPSLAAVRAAMTGRPDLIGPPEAADVQLLRADQRVVAKRGAEAVFAASWSGGGGPLGIAVKIEDGGGRACGPVVGALLRGLGAKVPDEVLTPAVLGGGAARGAIAASTAVRQLLT